MRLPTIHHDFRTSVEYRSADIMHFLFVVCKMLYGRSHCRTQHTTVQQEAIYAFLVDRSRVTVAGGGYGGYGSMYNLIARSPNNSPGRGLYFYENVTYEIKLPTAVPHY